MTRSLSLRVLVLALIAVAGAYAAAFLPGGPPPWASWSLLGGTVVSILAISALGAAPAEGGVGRLGWVFALTFLLVAGGLGLALALPEPVAGDPLVLGLPLGAAILVYCVGLLPLLVVPLAYAWTFPAIGFRPGEMEEIRDRARLAAEREATSRGTAPIDDVGGAGPE